MAGPTPPPAAAAVDPFGYEGQAEGYAAYRPSYPGAVLRHLWERPGAQRSGLAVDACCGTGKLSAALAGRFERVLGLDRSAEQLRHADRSAANVEYRQADCASLEGVADGSADLVSIGQALHWLDAAAFCAAAQRALRPGGHLAVLGYGVCSLAGGGAPQKAFAEYYGRTLGSHLPLGAEGNYWDCDRCMLDNGFSDVTFPFPSVARRWHYETKRMPVQSFLAYLTTWSGYQKYVAQTGRDPLVGLALQLGPHADGTVEVTIPYFSILARTAESPLPSLRAAYSAGQAQPPCEDCVPFDAKHYPNGLNANFLLGDDTSIVTEHVAKFEDPEKRDIARAVPEVVRVLTGCAGLTDATDIADIGAGTGLFLEPLAKVARSVLAMEISPAFLTHLRKQVAEKGLKNVSVVAGQPSDPCLGRGSVDVVLVCDVYHHFEYPRTVCGHLAEALRPGGRLVVIDFIRDEAVHKSHAPGWITEHVRAGQEVFRQEIESAGFRLLAEPRIPGLDENYCMVFESAARPAAPEVAAA